MFQKVFLLATLFVLATTTAIVSAASVDDAALRTRQFVVMGYTGLAYELRSGDGPYLKTLMELLNIPNEKRDVTIARFRELAAAHPNIMELADHVVTLQLAPVSPLTPLPVVKTPEGPSVYSGEKLDNALAHVTRGMGMTIYLKNGESFKAEFEEYNSQRLWVRGAAKKSYHYRDILAIDVPHL